MNAQRRTKNTNFSNACVYKIYCKDENIKALYVGQTCDFIRRKQQHKISVTMMQTRYNKGRDILYSTILNNGGWNNWAMEKIEEFPCDNKYELLEREAHWILELEATLNRNIKISNKEYKLEWYKKRRDDILNRQQQYREAIEHLYDVDLDNLENVPQGVILKIKILQHTSVIATARNSVDTTEVSDFELAESYCSRGSRSCCSRKRRIY
eukprot:gene13646-28982_t